MSDPLFDLPARKTVPVKGETGTFPVYRVFCVGRNYAAHAAEMGYEVDREAPFYFTKSATTVVASGGAFPYPPGTENYHYEMELVVALGAPVFRASREEAAGAVFGYACGLDMTRRDLQIASREKKRPWALGKDVENSAVIGTITRAGDFGAVAGQRIHLEVNGAVKQDASLADLIWKVDEVIAHLSGYYHLRPGDLIMTGTPAGVAAVLPGDRITGGIDGLEPVALEIGPAE